MSDHRKKVTKAEIVEAIHQDVDLKQEEILDVLGAFFSIVKESLGQDRIVELRGLGTFEIRTKQGRSGARNPKTGEIVSVETHGVPVFRPGRELRLLAWPVRTESEKR